MKFACIVNMYSFFRCPIFSMTCSLFLARWSSVRLVKFSRFSIFLSLLSPMSKTSRFTSLSKPYIFLILFAERYIFLRLTSPSRLPGVTSLMTLNAKSKKTRFDKWLIFSNFFILLSLSSSSTSWVQFSIPSIFSTKFFLRPSR